MGKIQVAGEEGSGRLAGSLPPAMSSSGLELISLEAGRFLTPGPGVLISSVAFILHFHELPFLPHRTTLFFRFFHLCRALFL
jgi:hypothetical protein